MHYQPPSSENSLISPSKLEGSEFPPSLAPTTEILKSCHIPLPSLESLCCEGSGCRCLGALHSVKGVGVIHVNSAVFVPEPHCSEM